MKNKRLIGYELKSSSGNCLGLYNDVAKLDDSIWYFMAIGYTELVVVEHWV
jgi:hypothetical protein